MIPKGPTAVFIDGANSYTAGKLLDRQLDLRLIKAAFEPYGRLHVFYYTAIRENEHGYNNLRPIVDWMQYNGFRVITKPATVVGTGDNARVKGNMDIELAVDIMTATAWADNFVLFSGDGDFHYVLKELHRRGKFVVVVSVLAVRNGINPNAHMISDVLRREADLFVNLNDPDGPGKAWFAQKREKDISVNNT